MMLTEEDVARVNQIWEWVRDGETHLRSILCDSDDYQPGWVEAGISEDGIDVEVRSEMLNVFHDYDDTFESVYQETLEAYVGATALKECRCWGCEFEKRDREP